LYYLDQFWETNDEPETKNLLRASTDSQQNANATTAMWYFIQGTTMAAES
jgi:hypothetical protein